MRKMGDLIPKRVDLSEIMREGPSELAKEREFSLTDLICDSDEEWIQGGADEDSLEHMNFLSIVMELGMSCSTRCLSICEISACSVAEDLASVETTYDASHAVRYEDALS
ncbi:uncharacterized protein LOC103853640 isoform X8 [Brassica rapa]|nr:uncharacterized protein LOC103853640 isoform X8 [Brassica rapa]